MFSSHNRPNFFKKAKKYTYFALFIAFSALLLAPSGKIYAQQQDRQADQFSASSALPTGGAMIKTSRVLVKLWGITVPNYSDNGIHIRARALLDRAISGGQIACRVFEWKGNIALSQCRNTAEQDLAVLLLSQGLAYVDREAVYDQSSLRQAYTEAERTAMTLQKGVWFDPTVSAVNFLDFENLRPDLKNNLFLLVALVSAVPLVGLIIIAFIMFSGFGRLIHMQKRQIAKVGKNEKDMKDREKYVLASSFDGELQANKSKVEAFLTIYRELLKDIRNPNKTPKYKQTGDIIHDKPSLMRMVYDANIDKLSLLGPSMAKLLTELYTEIETSPSYQTLDPDVPLEEAERRVEAIVIQAEKYVPIIDKLLTGLNVVTRNQ